MNKLKRLSFIGLVLSAVWLPPVYAETVEKIAGQVVKVDIQRAKITLAHGPIKSLNMSAMTMPFKVRDPSMLTAVKPGDKVVFSAAVVQNEVMVTQLEVNNARKGQP